MIFNDNPNPIHQRVRAGLSLVEILIALTMTLIVLGAMMSAFQYASAEMQNGRATLEMANRVRVAENLLRRDLANLTVEPRPYIGNAIPNGYFEYIEGPRRDLKLPFTASSGSTMPVTDQDLSYLGDSDDILAMTCRSTAGSVFRGRQYDIASDTTSNIESTYAEIIWWTFLNDSSGDLIIDYSEGQTIFRRVLIVNPELNVPVPGFPNERAVLNDIPYGQAMEWLALSDVSARFEPAFGASAANNVAIVANSLQDLSNRRNRAFRRALRPVGSANADFPNTDFAFPYPLNRTTLSALRASQIASSGGSDFDGDTIAIEPNGNDIVVTDVAAFDVRVFSPDCALSDLGGFVLEPSDPGYPDGTGTIVDADEDGVPFFADANDADMNNTELGPSISQGAYVDLGHHGSGAFSQPITSTPPIGPAGFYSTTGIRGRQSPLNYQFFFDQLNVAGGTPAFPNVDVRPVLNGLLETVYDTWSPVYESDGLNQDDQTVPVRFRVNLLPLAGVSAANRVATANIVDQGTDGIDNDGVNGPDDYNERETQPPYNHPITGLKVTFRLVEKQTGQVRQSSIVHNYGAQ